MTLPKACCHGRVNQVTRTELDSETALTCWFTSSPVVNITFMEVFFQEMVLN